MKKIIIAIDGFSSCGKSTMARQLAAELDYVFIDSGAMYRAITLYFLKEQTDLSDSLAIQGSLKQVELHFENNPETKQSEMYLNGKNIAREIRSMEVATKVSEVAAIATVRNFAVAAQQAMGKSKAIVMDGRDIGTTVFPDAELKIFVTASIEVRTHRRYEELKSTQPDISIAEVRENLLLRDHIDSTRAVSPLRQAEDAILLDNSLLDRDEQLALVKKWALERIHA